MFCTQCGHPVTSSQHYCPSCGAVLSQPHPQSLPVMPGAGTALWNPTVAVLWSILFTPIFGAYLQASNWRVLGQLDAARASMRWCYASVGVVLLLIVAEVIFATGGLAEKVLLGYLALWYGLSGRLQGGYLRQQYAGHYLRRGWGWPLLAAFSTLLGLLMLAMPLGYALGYLSAMLGAR